MASELKSNNARSPRFSTTKALGFRGGSTGAGGNIQEPTFQQVEGNVPAAPARPKEAPPGGTTSAPAISQFSATVPQGPSLPATLAGGAVSAVGGEAVKAGVKGISGLLGIGYGAAPGTLAAANAVGASGGDAIGSLIEQNADRWGLDLGYGAAPGTLEVANTVGASGGDAIGSLIEQNADRWGVDVGGDILAGGEGADSLIGGAGPDALGEAATGGIGFGDVLPYAPAVYNLAKGDVKGAVLSGAGAFLGNAILPGIGGGIGATIGSALGSGCFITEAVMSAGGQGDTAPELQALRQFRDGVLAATPQGQALIQEYESIAPMVVDSVMMRPDALQIFQAIDAQFINPAVQAIQQGDFQKALQIYSQMIAFVTPYAAEGAETGQGGMMMPGQDGQAGAMQKMGEHAAMVGHSPEMAGAATGDMGMMDDDPNGYDGGPQGMPMAGNPMQQQFAKPRY